MGEPALATDNQLQSRVQAVRTAWVRHLEHLHGIQDHRGGNRPERPERVWASRWSPCDRELALDMLHPEDRQDWTVDGLERMQRGREREESVVARLMAAGKWANPTFTVEASQQRFTVESPDEPGLVVASGKLEGRIKWADGFRAPYEIKSGETFKRAETVADLDRGKWTRGAVPQLLIAMVALQEPLGFVVIDRPGVPFLIPVLLHEAAARVHTMIERYEAAVRVRLADGEGLAEAITYDSEVCGRCSHLGKPSCPSPPGFKPGGEVIVDAELEEACRVVHTHGPRAKDVKRAKDLIRDRCRGHEVARVGAFEVRGGWAKKSVLGPMPEKKRKELDRVKRWAKRLTGQFSRVDPKGTFSVRGVRVVE